MGRTWLWPVSSTDPESARCSCGKKQQSNDQCIEAHRPFLDNWYTSLRGVIPRDRSLGLAFGPIAR